MGRKHYHSVKDVLTEFLKSEGFKTVVGILGIELALFLFVAYKGLGINYFQII